MSTRQIRIEGERMRPERIPVGTRGSYAMVNLSFSFDSEWSGLTKKIVFYPQRGEPVYRVYTAGDAVVPAEVMQYAGESPFVVSGYETDGEGTLLRKVISCPGILIVEHTLSDVGHEPEIPSASAFENIVEKLGAPYIGDNGNWFVWDAESNSFMDTGLPSRGIQGETGRGLTILGHYDTLVALKAAVSAPADGDAYSVGTVLPYAVYIWDGALGEWVDHGNLRGVGIQKIEQISSSTDSLGANVIRVTLDDGSFYDYTVRNGDRGPAGSLWIGTSEPPDDSYSIWLNPSGMVSGYVGANQGAENAGRVLGVGEDGVVIPREETQPDYTQNDITKPDYIKNRPGGYYEEQKTYKLDISAVKQDGIDELILVSILTDLFMHRSSIDVEIGYESGVIKRTLTQRYISEYIINQYGAQIYGNAHLIDASQPDTGEDMALYKEMDSQSNYSIGWHVWATSVPSGDVEVCVVEKTRSAVPFDQEFIPWYASPTKESVLYTAQSMTEDQQEQARANIGAGTPYTLPEASPDALGGVKADAAETADTQPVRKGTDGKLYTAPGSDTSIGITGASAGQIPKVKAVDASGAPTEWKSEKDTTPFIVTVGTASSGYTSSHTFDEIAAAASAGRVVMAYTDYINFPQVGQSLYGAYFDLISTQDVATFVYIDPWNMIKYAFDVDPLSISASASYLSATSSTFGGVKADSAEATDTQPVRIGGDGKLYTAPGSGGGADISLGISGATAGQMAKVKAVDASGAPTAWEAGGAASGEALPLLYHATINEAITDAEFTEIDGNPISLSEVKVRACFTANGTSWCGIEIYTSAINPNNKVVKADTSGVYTTADKIYFTAADGKIEDGNFEASFINPVDFTPYINSSNDIRGAGYVKSIPNATYQNPPELQENNAPDGKINKIRIRGSFSKLEVIIWGR